MDEKIKELHLPLDPYYSVYQKLTVGAEQEEFYWGIDLDTVEDAKQYIEEIVNRTKVKKEDFIIVEADFRVVSNV